MSIVIITDSDVHVYMIPKVIAHRGACSVAPENTMSAFRAAFDLGTDGFETDVQITKDSVPVIQHNYSIEENSDGEGKVSEMTLDELRGFDFGSWFDERFAGERIATLEECLGYGKRFRLVNIEIKAPVSEKRDSVLPVAEMIASSGYPERIIVSSFDHSILKEIKETYPELRVGALVYSKMIAYGAMLDRCLPGDKKLCSVTLADASIPDDTLRTGSMDMSADDMRRWAVNMVNSIGMTYPWMTVRELAEEARRQSDLCTYAKEIGFELDYMHCDYPMCLKDPSMVDRLHGIGVGVNIWTPNDEDLLRRLAAMGPDGIITNRPDTLLKILREND